MNLLFVAGLFSAFGIPLMGMAMGNTVTLLIKFDDRKSLIKQKVTRSELDMMKKFGLEDGDGKLDKSEYILLCCVRLGALHTGLVEEIDKRFATLDRNGDGLLTRSELLEELKRASVFGSMLARVRLPPAAKPSNTKLNVISENY